MAKILETKNFSSTVVTSVDPGTSPVSGWQLVGRFLATEVPNVPDGTRTCTVVVTGRIANQENGDVLTGGGQRAVDEITLRTSNGSYFYGSHLHRLTHNGPHYVSPLDRAHPFLFILRRVNWPAAEHIDVVGRVALLGDAINSGTPPSQYPRFTVTNLSIAVFDDTALGSKRALWDAVQPSVSVNLNTFAGSVYGTPSQLYLSATTFPFRIQLQANCAIALSVSDTIANAPSAATKTATVTVAAGTSQNFIELGAVTGGPWTPGDPVYKGATQVGTVALGTEQWLVVTTARMRPRSYNHMASIWCAKHGTGVWGSSSDAWGQDLLGAVAKGAINPDGSGAYAGIYFNEYSVGCPTLLTIENGTTTIGCKGISLYDPAVIAPSGQSTAQFVRLDIFAVKLTGLPLPLASLQTLQTAWYDAEGSHTQILDLTLTASENRRATAFAWALPLQLGVTPRKSIASRLRFNDGSDRPITYPTYIGCEAPPNGYPEGLPDLTIAALDVVEDVNRFEWRGILNPRDGWTLRVPAQTVGVALVPHADDATIYPAVPAPIDGPVVYVQLGREVANAASLSELTIEPDVTVEDELVGERSEIVTLNGYSLSAPDFSAIPRRVRATWSVRPKTEIDALVAFFKACPNGLFRWRDKSEEPDTPEHPYRALRTYILSGPTFEVSEDLEGKSTFTASATFLELVWFT